jgi:hypothetical protein
MDIFLWLRYDLVSNLDNSLEKVHFAWAEDGYMWLF